MIQIKYKEDKRRPRQWESVRSITFLYIDEDSGEEIWDLATEKFGHIYLSECVDIKNVDLSKILKNNLRLERNRKRRNSRQFKKYNNNNGFGSCSSCGYSLSGPICTNCGRDDMT